MKKKAKAPLIVLGAHCLNSLTLGGVRGKSTRVGWAFLPEVCSLNPSRGHTVHNGSDPGKGRGGFVVARHPRQGKPSLGWVGERHTESHHPWELGHEGEAEAAEASKSQLSQVDGPGHKPSLTGHLSQVTQHRGPTRHLHSTSQRGRGWSRPADVSAVVLVSEKLGVLCSPSPSTHLSDLPRDSIC